MTDVIDFAVQLAKALFKAFGAAVENYPFTTLLVLLAIFGYLHSKNLCKLVDIQNQKPNYGFSFSDAFFGLLGFIISVLVANFVGYIFNAIVMGLGAIFHAGEAFVRPFDKHPLEFTIILFLFLIIEAVYLLVKNRWRITQENFAHAIVLGFLALFSTYVATSLFVEIHGDKETTLKGSHERGGP